MAINDSTKYLKYANVQMAAESLFGVDLVNVAPSTTKGAGSMSQQTLVRGNNRASQFTKTQATEFLKNLDVVERLADTKTGFSGTLFRALKDDPAAGITAGELVLSFRSTEFIDDAARDNMATNTLEVKESGWAFIAEGHVFQNRKTPNPRADTSVSGGNVRLRVPLEFT